ncbi:MAG: methyltransferase domain-containing protein [Gammaproteobacteria bacterium]|jgi:trans-aconitate methyltransferase|nr:methyltransferase domain-containing protein [Gammaproteobacteria bacterium]
MNETSRQDHWESVYSSKASTDVSWFQPRPERSLQLIERTAVGRDEAIIDIGGGASTLVDHLLEDGFTDITVLDVSGRGLEQAQERLGDRADNVKWVVSDVTAFLPSRTWQLWHDRAALHFLVEEQDRERYVEVLKSALAPGGHLVLAMFGPSGPLKCSGLEIRRYSIEMVEELLGPEFGLQCQELENHITPMGSNQQFLYSCWTRRE